MMRDTKSFGPLNRRTDRIRLMGSGSSEWDQDFELFDQSYEDIVSGIFCSTESRQEKQSSEHNGAKIAGRKVLECIWERIKSLLALIFFFIFIGIPMEMLIISQYLLLWGGALSAYALEHDINEMLLRWVLLGVSLNAFAVVVMMSLLFIYVMPRLGAWVVWGEHWRQYHDLPL